MSTSDQQKEWQAWQPRDLLAELSPPAPKGEKLAGTASSELSQTELKHHQQLAEQKGFAQGVVQGVEEGKKQGYEQGMALGRKEGEEQALAEAESQQNACLERLTSLLENFQNSLDSLDRIIPSRLVQIALTAAREIVGSQCQPDSKIVLERIQQLLQQDSLFKGPLRLTVSEDDRQRVEENLGSILAKRGWELHGNAKMLPGGCLITAEDGELDATLDARWQALCHLSREDRQP